jgi:hypothetical protein
MHQRLDGQISCAGRSVAAPGSKSHELSITHEPRNPIAQQIIS